MRMIAPYLFIISVAGIIFILSCKKEKSCEGCNKPPIAIAGPDHVITLPADSILVDGSASNDPDGTISEWLWKKISGPASYNIVNAASAKTMVRDLDTGVYRFEVKVTDNGNLSATDTVQITVNDPGRPNRPPVANAGTDQTITLPLNNVNLDGRASTDPDNNISSYLWTKISGPSSLTISNDTAIQTQAINVVQGVYQFELKVTDAGGLFAKDTTNVTVISNSIPACALLYPAVIQATLTHIGTLSVPRMAIAGAGGTKVVFAGGWSAINCTNHAITSASAAVDIYDTQTQSWSNAQLSIPRGGIRSVTNGNKIFFAGGEDGISTTYNNVDIYDISTNTWITQHLSVPRAYVATATIGNKVFFAGGHFYTATSSPANPNGFSNIVDIYDVSADQWSSTVLSGTTTGLYTSTAVNGKIYFAGGNNNGIIHIYDNYTNSWSTSNLQFQWQTGAPFPGNPVTSFAIDDNIYWAGIVDEGGAIFPWDYTGRVEVMNTINDMTTIKCFPLFYSQYPVIKNNEVAFFSSYHNQNWGQWGTTQTFPIYNAVNDTWSTGAINSGSYNMNHDGAFVSLNNTIYTGGGWQFSPSCVAFTDKVYILSW